jgi:hypothetical protein
MPWRLLKSRFQIFACVILALAAMGQSVYADDDARAAQLSAANANAVNNLMGDIEGEQIDATYTVHLFLDKTNSQPRLLAILQKAQQIGGPRWLDEQTCQIQLEIPGPSVAHELIAIAGDSASPLTPDQIRVDLKPWDSRVFSGTGTSTASIEAISPPVSSPAWKGVPDADVRAAVTAARQDAVNQVLDSIAPVPLATGKTLRDALAIPDVASVMAQWVGHRPVTLVDFREDGTVEVTLSVPAAAVYDKLHATLAARADIPVPVDEKGWSIIADGISRSMANPVGVGKVTPSTQPAIVLIASQPPDWIERQIDAAGTGPATDSRLRSASLARAAAALGLREQILALLIAPNVTLGSAADRDPRLADSIERAIHTGGHVYTVDYRTDGTVVVRMSIDLRDLWDQIAARR